MFQKIAKHRANDASNDVHRPPLVTVFSLRIPKEGGCNIDKSVTGTQSNSVWTESTDKA